MSPLDRRIREQRQADCTRRHRAGNTADNITNRYPGTRYCTRCQLSDAYQPEIVQCREAGCSLQAVAA